GQSERHLRAESERAEGGVLLAGACAAVAKILSLQRTVKPAAVCSFHTGRAGLHVILRIEVRAGHVRRAGGMHDGEMTLVIERFEGRELGMKAKEAVEIDDLVLWNRDRRAHRVVVFFMVGNHHVEPIDCAALEDNDQPLARSAGSLRNHAANEKAGNGRGARDGERASVKKKSAIHMSLLSPQLSASSACRAEHQAES